MTQKLYIYIHTGKGYRVPCSPKPSFLRSFHPNAVLPSPPTLAQKNPPFPDDPGPPAAAVTSLEVFFGSPLGPEFKGNVATEATARPCLLQWRDAYLSQGGAPIYEIKSAAQTKCSPKFDVMTLIHMIPKESIHPLHVICPTDSGECTDGHISSIVINDGGVDEEASDDEDQYLEGPHWHTAVAAVTVSSPQDQPSMGSDGSMPPPRQSAIWRKVLEPLVHRPLPGASTLVVGGLGSAGQRQGQKRISCSRAGNLEVTVPLAPGSRPGSDEELEQGDALPGDDTGVATGGRWAQQGDCTHQGENEGGQPPLSHSKRQKATLSQGSDADGGNGLTSALRRFHQPSAASSAAEDQVVPESAHRQGRAAGQRQPSVDDCDGGPIMTARRRSTVLLIHSSSSSTDDMSPIQDAVALSPGQGGLMEDHWDPDLQRNPEVAHYHSSVSKTLETQVRMCQVPSDGQGIEGPQALGESTIDGELERDVAGCCTGQPKPQHPSLLPLRSPVSPSPLQQHQQQFSSKSVVPVHTSVLVGSARKSWWESGIIGGGRYSIRGTQEETLRPTSGGVSSFKFVQAMFLIPRTEAGLQKLLRRFLPTDRFLARFQFMFEDVRKVSGMDVQSWILFIMALTPWHSLTQSHRGVIFLFK